MVQKGHSLTPRQARFVQEYLIDLNARQAAIRAGYSAKTAEVQASRLLRNAHVRAAADAAMAKRSERVLVTGDEVIAELRRIALSQIGKAVRWGEGLAVKDALTGEERIVNGVALIDSADLDEDTLAAIAEVRQGRDGSLSLKMHDKKGALVELGRHLNLFRDRPIKLDLPEIKAAADVVTALGVVAQAMARGELTPSEAQAVSNVLELRRRAIETTELEARLAVLEGGRNAGA
jgi:phage terminase small subunit